MKKIFFITIFIALFVVNSAYCSTIFQQSLFEKNKELTVSGGATPSANSITLNLDRSSGLVSLVLENSGDSTSLTVTYQIGVISNNDVDGDGFLNDMLWSTPSDGGNVTELTAVDATSDTKHASLSLSMGKYYRFTIANNDAINTATINLYAIYQIR